MGKKTKKTKRFSWFLNNPVDFTLVIVVIILLSLGLIMVLSASSPKSLSEYGTSYQFFIKQLIFAVLGVIAMMMISKIDYRFYQKFYKVAWILSALLLVAVMLVGKEVNNAKRWIYITKTLSFQPSEIVKILMIIFYAGILTKNKDDLGNFWSGLVKHICMLAPIIVLLMLQPHFSASIVIIGTSCIMMIMAGCKMWQFLASGLSVGIPLIVVLVKSAAYRLERVTTFLDPWSNPTDEGWQVIQSLYAIGSGGLFGSGLGESKQKYLYLPEPHNDFIFSVLAEELGFIGCAIVIILFAIFIWRGILIAMKAPEMFGSLIAIGITSLIGIQVVINIAVVTSSMPATGMPLPFFSYGGTALFILLCEVGILLNISRTSNKI
ncbi:MAG: putative lipid II flippase FtsW [Clostridia bacterium]|nr:putative lipid II flippase FtsW [Clostridia bacterium]